jgi:hypothetical protein
MRQDEPEFQRILASARDLGLEYPDGLILIGGIAVYLQATERRIERLREATYDADLMISLADYSSLRDREEVTPNARLGKSQIIKDGIEFDIYVERQLKLAVSYEEASNYADLIDGVRVASLEHLLVLKTDAALDRAASIKGEKDERDIARIVLMLEAPRRDLLEPYLSERRLAKLNSLVERPTTFRELAKDNAHDASILRKKFSANLRSLVSVRFSNEYKGPSP